MPRPSAPGEPGAPGSPFAPSLPVTSTGEVVDVESFPNVITERIQMNEPGVRVGVEVDQPEEGATVSDEPTAYCVTVFFTAELAASHASPAVLSRSARKSLTAWSKSPSETPATVVVAVDDVPVKRLSWSYAKNLTCTVSPTAPTVTICSPAAVRVPCITQVPEVPTLASTRTECAPSVPPEL